MNTGQGNRLKTSQSRNLLGTASRLATGNRHLAQPGNASLSFANNLKVDDRPVTHQGLSGIKLAAKGPRRQIEDQYYYIGVLRGKIVDLEKEIKHLNDESVRLRESNASYLQYEKMAEKLASDIEELQGTLGVYNTLVDRANRGGDAFSVQSDVDDIKDANIHIEQQLALLFESRRDREGDLRSLEKELKQETEMAETALHEMSVKQREKYLQYRDTNAQLKETINDFQMQQEKLCERKRYYESEVMNRMPREEALHLHTKIRELEQQNQQLKAERAATTNPQDEKENLLQQVREDNQEIVQMEKEIGSLQERISFLEEQVSKGGQHPDNQSSERAQKYNELVQREAEIDDFMGSYENLKTDEETNCEKLNKEIEGILEKISRHHSNLAQTKQLTVGEFTPGEVKKMQDQLSFKSDEVGKSEATLQAIEADRMKLQQDLLKVDQLESKIEAEADTLRQKIATMDTEINTFSAVEETREEYAAKRVALEKRKDELNSQLQAAQNQSQQLVGELSAIQRELEKSQVYLQLKELEKRWGQLEQVNHTLNESVLTKRLATDHSNYATRVFKMVEQFNDRLKQDLMNAVPS